jgi:hypothetical protein
MLLTGVYIYRLFKSNNSESILIYNNSYVTVFMYSTPSRYYSNQKCKQVFKLFGFPIFRLWANLMKVIPETRRTH